VGGDIKLNLYVKRDEGASDEHEETKTFAIECLARGAGARDEKEVMRILKDRKIEIEHELLSNGGRADVYVSSK
jgi:adenosine deaminase